MTYKQNSLQAKFAKKNSLEMQGELHGVEGEFQNKTSIKEKEVGRECGDALRNWQLMFRVPEDQTQIGKKQPRLPASSDDQYEIPA